MTSLDRVEFGAIVPRSKQAEAGKPVKQRQEVPAGGQMLPLVSANSEQAQAARIELGQAMDSVADYVQNIAREINFRIDEETDKFVVTVTDQESGEVIRQIPNEEMLAISRNLATAQSRNFGKVVKGLLFQGDA